MPALTIEYLESRLAPAYGLDPNFGTMGMAPLDPESDLRQQFLAAMPDDDLLVATSLGSGSVRSGTLQLLNRDGGPDVAFGTDGSVELPFGLSVKFLVARPDGKILVGGDQSNYDLGLAYLTVVYQFNADGSPDTSFGSGGSTEVGMRYVGGVPIVGQGSAGRLLALADDGSILFTSYRHEFDSGSVRAFGFSVTKLTPGGTIDANFGTDGTAAVPISFTEPFQYPFPASLSDIEIQDDGKIVLAGEKYFEGPYSDENGNAVGGGSQKYEPFLVRLLSDGTPDSTFGTNGMLAVGDLVGLTGTDASLRNAIATADGLVVWIESVGEGSYLLRLGDDGSPDPAFGTDGVVRFDSLLTDALDTGIQQLPDGRFVLIGGRDGRTSIPYRTWFDTVVHVYSADGSLEEEFALRGTPTGPDGNFTTVPVPSDLIATTDGRIVFVYTDFPSGSPNGEERLAALVEGGLPGEPPTSPPAPEDPTPMPTEIPPSPVAGDLDGDGVAETVSVVDTNHLRVIDGRTGAVLVERFQPYEVGYLGGLSWVTGDLDGNGVSELAVCAQEGGSARVVVLRLTADGSALEQVHSFFGIDDANFRGGGHLALGRYLPSGRQLVVGAGMGGGPRVTVYDGASLATGAAPAVVDDFFAFEDGGFRGGCFVDFVSTQSDIDVLAVGAGPGGAPRVQVFRATPTAEEPRAVIANDFLSDPNGRDGIDVNGMDDEVRNVFTAVFSA